MAGLFAPKRANQQTPVATGLHVTGALYGRPRAIGWGQARSGSTIIDYAGFSAAKAKSPGGKGGLVGGGGGKGGTGNYNYSASVVVSFGEAINSLIAIYNSNAVDFFVTPDAKILAELAVLGVTPTYGNTYNIDIHNGASGQLASPYWTSAFPTRALAYREQSLGVFPNLSLGSSASFPNFNFEILWPINSDIPALGPDANPADVIADFLTNPVYGVTGFASSKFFILPWGPDPSGVQLLSGVLGDFDTARNYWRATGLLISDVLEGQTSAQSWLKSLMTALNAEFRWTNGQLAIVPYGDVAITGNGYTYTPNVTPEYDLTVDDFMPNQGSLGASRGAGDTPVAFVRADVLKVPNKIQVEYKDRQSLYNSAIIYASDDASIADRGLRISDKKDNHFFALASAASMSAGLQLHRMMSTLTTYQVTVGKRFCLLEPLDLVTLTEPSLQLDRQLCRITEIQEQSDHSRVLTLEEVSLSALAPIYGRQALAGAGRNNNAPAGPVNPPIFFEPPDQIGHGLMLWIGLSGAAPAIWGGCDVYVSSDGESYSLAGSIDGATRMGVLTTPMASFTRASSGPTIDISSAFAVDLSESYGTLANGSALDFAAFNTAMLVDGEIIAYQNATLTGANAYTLSPPISRGGYGTAIASHAIGAPVMRLDGQAFEWPFTSDRIGQTMYFKFTSFNSFGGGAQGLGDVGAYPHLLTGSALASPLPSVPNLRAVFESGVTKVWWDEIVDFRPILYEVRKGPAWSSAILIGRLAHPPFVAFGDDTYWVSAVTTPASGITVYSGTPTSLAIAGALLSQNIVRTYDEQATGWGGTFSNGCAKAGTDPHAYILLGGGGSILADANILTTADVLNYGGIVAIGNYEIPVAHQIDVGYVASALIGATYVGTGQPLGQNLLSDANILTIADILGAASAQFVDVHVEIAVSQVSPASWGAWQKFVPGVYVGRIFKFRQVLATIDISVVPVGLAFSYQVTVPARIDHYQNLNIPAAGLTITFKPDGSSSAAPFNGGPNGSVLPYLNATWQNQAGDTLVFTVTASSATVQILNAGVGVARSGVNIDVEGF